MDETPSPSPQTPEQARGDGHTHHSRWGVLRHRHFRNVWFGAFGSSVGNLMEFVGLSWVINVTTDKPQLWLGWHAAAQLAPMMILGIVGGVLADRVNRKKLLIATQAIMMVIAATLTIASYGRYPTIATVMTLTALLGAVGAFNVPAWQVLTPRLVPRAELTEAIVLNGLQFNMARVIGPALGGVLLGLFGPFALFAINTFSFLGVMFAVSTTPDAPAPPRVEGKSVWAELREALSFIYHRKGPWAAFLAMTVYGFLGAPLQRMLPQYASEVYFTRELPKGQQEITYGLLLATMGLGAIGGAFLMRGLPKWYPKHHLIPIAVLVSGVCMAAFGAARSMWIGIPMLLVCGAGWLISFNATYAAMQLLVPDAMRGRVLAICNTAVFGVMGLGPVLSGYIGGLIGDRMTPVMGIQMGVAGAGAILAAAGIVMLIWRTPEVDGLHPGDPGYDHRPGVFAGITASAHRPRPTQAD